MPEGVSRYPSVAEGCCGFGKPLPTLPLGSQRPHSLFLRAESLLQLSATSKVLQAAVPVCWGGGGVGTEDTSQHVRSTE